jgi:hypothetical protein
MCLGVMPECHCPESHSFWEWLRGLKRWYLVLGGVAVGSGPSPTWNFSPQIYLYTAGTLEIFTIVLLQMMRFLIFHSHFFIFGSIWLCFDDFARIFKIYPQIKILLQGVQYKGGVNFF